LPPSDTPSSKKAEPVQKYGRLSWQPILPPSVHTLHAGGNVSDDGNPDANQRRAYAQLEAEAV